MSRIFYLMGKSSSGKDTIFQQLLDDRKLGLTRFVPYTTRPVRAGEKEGREYHFVTVERFHELMEEGRVIEHRIYDTVEGPWIYFTADDRKEEQEERNCLAIGTLESYRKIKAYYGEENVVPIYLEVEDGVRLERALKREKMQKKPKYAEMCRRFLADTEDFSEENLAEAGVEKRFENQNFALCMEEIKEYIQSRRIMI